jgi:hypothetical protein
MNYVTEYTIILTALYIFIVAVCYSPKDAIATESEPINYFPESEVMADPDSHEYNWELDMIAQFANEETEPAIETESAIADPELPDPKLEIAEDALMLTLMSVTQLRAKAKKAGVPKYGTMLKAKLIKALAHV